MRVIDNTTLLSNSGGISMSSNNRRGFTLIELMVAIAVLAITAAVAFPTSKAFMQTNRMASVTNSLTGSIAYTRSEAINRGSPVSICSSSDGASCTNTAWELGWIVFTDSGAAGTVDGTDTILQVAPTADANVSVTGSGTFIRFRPSGSLTDLITPDQSVKRFAMMILHGIETVIFPADVYADSTSDGDSEVTVSCTAPDPEGGSSNDSESGSENVSGDENESGDDGESGDGNGSATPASASAGTANCGDSANSTGSGSGYPTQTSGSTMPNNSFLVCDGERNGEFGSLIIINNIGRILRQRVNCN